MREYSLRVVGTLLFLGACVAFYLLYMGKI